MRKVTLQLESLSVESFSTAPAAAADLVRASADCSVVCTYEWDCTV